MFAGIFFSPAQDTTTSPNPKKQKSLQDTPPVPTKNQTYDYFVNAIPTDPPMTHTPTPLPGAFYTPNGKQNDLVIKLIRKNDWDIFVQVQLVNTKTKEIRVMGRALEASPGDSSFFSKDFSKVTFVGGTPYEEDYEKISIYSIPQKKIIKQISLADMKKALPSLQIKPNAILSRLLPSPDTEDAAFSYGEILNDSSIDPNTNIITLDLTTNHMTLLPVKGLMKSWKDKDTLEYETTSNPSQEIKL
jgi:hypothetical protein